VAEPVQPKEPRDAEDDAPGVARAPRWPVWDELLEALAAEEHASWGRWMIYLFSICTDLPDGSVMIPKELALRWTRQMHTHYRDLPENERESDREEVRRVLPIIRQAMQPRRRRARRRTDGALPEAPLRTPTPPPTEAVS
jgi:hypothetical protein